MEVKCSNTRKAEKIAKLQTQGRYEEAVKVMTSIKGKECQMSLLKHLLEKQIYTSFLLKRMMVEAYTDLNYRF